VPFLIIEPFGDNDCYWIVAEALAVVGCKRSKEQARRG
jgi:hypothetical protein